MLDFRAPDGSEPQFIYSSTPHSFTIPAYHAAILGTYPGGAWEQCALIYVGGYQINTMVGTNPDWPRFVHLYALPYPQWVTLTGWHKEGSPDPDLPWLPSQSTLLRPGSVGWRDSTAVNAPYDDLIMDYAFEVDRRVERFDATPPPPHAYQVSTPTRASQVAQWLSDLSALAEAGRTSLTRLRPARRRHRHGARSIIDHTTGGPSNPAATGPPISGVRAGAAGSQAAGGSLRIVGCRAERHHRSSAAPNLKRSGCQMPCSMPADPLINQHARSN